MNFSNLTKFFFFNFIVLGFLPFVQAANPKYEKQIPEGTLLQNQLFSGALVSIHPDGRAFFQRPGHEPKSILLSQIIHWGNFTPLKPSRVVFLVDGTRYALAQTWGAQRGVELIGTKLTLRSKSLGEVSLKRNQVQGIILRPNKNPALFQKQIALLDQVEEQDRVFLTNGDQLLGDFLELNRSHVVFKSSTGNSTIPTPRIAAIRFKSTLKTSDELNRSRFLLDLKDGSRLVLKNSSQKENEKIQQLSASFAKDDPLIKKIIAIHSSTPTVSYLSDLEPEASRHVPYISLKRKYQRDRSVVGSPLKIKGKFYLKGLGVTSVSQLAFNLTNQDWKRFVVTLGVDEAALDNNSQGNGSVRFRVLLAKENSTTEKIAWTEAYRSKILRGGDSPITIKINLAEAHGLMLVTEYADRGDERDYADWLDARLER